MVEVSEGSFMDMIINDISHIFVHKLLRRTEFDIQHNISYNVHISAIFPLRVTTTHLTTIPLTRRHLTKKKPKTNSLFICGTQIKQRSNAEERFGKTLFLLSRSGKREVV